MMAHRDQIAGSAASRSSIPRLPNRPPFAPVAPIRVAASCGVSHVMLRQTITVQPHKPNDPQVEHTYLVPGLLTSGSATHCNEEAHEERANLSPTHCPSWPLTHAVSPVEHAELAVSPWNLRLRACASSPFWSVNAARFSTLALLDMFVSTGTPNKTKSNVYVRTVVQLCCAPRPRAYPLDHRWHQWQQYDRWHLAACHR